MSDEELVEFHDGRGGETNRETIATIREELFRRRISRSNKRLEKLTWAIIVLTVVITLLTYILVAKELNWVPFGN